MTAQDVACFTARWLRFMADTLDPQEASASRGLQLLGWAWDGRVWAPTRITTSTNHYLTTTQDSERRS